MDNMPLRDVTKDEIETYWRRAIGHRWSGDDATYVRRAHVARILPPCDLKLKTGDSFPTGDHHLYPEVWPTPAKSRATKAAKS